MNTEKIINTTETLLKDYLKSENLRLEVEFFERGNQIKRIIITKSKDIISRSCKKYQTTTSRVERAIRHAIEVTWSRHS